MANFFQRLLGRTNPQHPTRLSESQARAIANEAVADTPYESMMGMTKAEDRGGRQVWIVGSNTIGSGITIIIDDVTGEVIGRESWGVR